jgi:hypothetical protein
VSCTTQGVIDNSFGQCFTVESKSSRSETSKHSVCLRMWGVEGRLPSRSLDGYSWLWQNTTSVANTKETDFTVDIDELRRPYHDTVVHVIGGCTRSHIGELAYRDASTRALTSMHTNDECQVDQCQSHLYILHPCL